MTPMSPQPVRQALLQILHLFRGPHITAFKGVH